MINKYFRLELYFSNKQGSPRNTSNANDLSVPQQNNTTIELQSNKQSGLNVSKETESNDSFQNITGKLNY